MLDVTTKRCPYCAEEIRAQAIKCRYCGSLVDGEPLGGVFSRVWYRSRQGKRVAGVCAGLARQFDVPVTVLRLAFVLGTLFGGGVGIIIYIALWVVMPYPDDELDPFVSGMDEPQEISSRRRFSE